MPTPDLNPVQVAIRDHAAARFSGWRRDTPQIVTRAGARYRGLDVALLLRPVLRDAGLYVYDDGNYFNRVFVSGSGKRVTRDALRSQVLPALAGLDDPALVATVRSEAFFSALADLMPEHEGRVEFTRRETQRREVPADDLAYVAQILRDNVEGPTKVADVFEIYLDLSAGDDLPSVGRTSFYRIAEETGVVRRVRRRDGSYFLPVARAVARKVARFVKRLSDLATEALTRSGVEDTETYADDVVERITGRAPAGPEAVGSRLLALAEALPFPVASAIASADDPHRALTLVGKMWAERHPETRPVIAEAAREFGPDLVEAVRVVVASALAEESA